MILPSRNHVVVCFIFVRLIFVYTTNKHLGRRKHLRICLFPFEVATRFFRSSQV